MPVVDFSPHIESKNGLLKEGAGNIAGGFSKTLYCHTKRFALKRLAKGACHVKYLQIKRSALFHMARLWVLGFVLWVIGVSVWGQCTITLTSGNNTQTVCTNTSIANINYTTEGAIGATFLNLPTGVNGTWNNNSITISGTPTTSGIYNYGVILTGIGCDLNPVATGIITANPLVPVSVTIVSNDADNNICAGTSVTFTATPTNEGANQTYQWYVDSTPIATGSTFTTNTLGNGNQVRVEMTSNAACPNPVPAVSNVITITVNPVVIPSVTISASETEFCEGTLVTFTAATPTNVGLNPTYQWFVGATIVGTNSDT